MITTIPSSSGDTNKYMRIAIDEARKALAKGEVPIGAVIVCHGPSRTDTDRNDSNDRIIARAHNLTETLTDPTAHAEMQAITMAASELGGKYLTQCTLYVTVEPCVMCAGAIGWAQVPQVVYGCRDEKRGFLTFAPNALHPKAVVTGGVLEEECRELMQEFFRQRR